MNRTWLYLIGGTALLWFLANRKSAAASPYSPQISSPGAATLNDLLRAGLAGVERVTGTVLPASNPVTPAMPATQQSLVDIGLPPSYSAPSTSTPSTPYVPPSGGVPEENPYERGSNL